MRTKSEHIIGKLRAMGRRLCRLKRAAVTRVRRVLTRKRGGLSNRHLAEVSDCAPAAPLCVYSETAADMPGLPMEMAEAARPARMPAIAVSDKPISAPHMSRARLARRERHGPTADLARQDAAIVNGSRLPRAALRTATG